MYRLATATTDNAMIPAPSCVTEINGVRIVLDPAGAMLLPQHSLLCVSDLHLEKGAAFARRGQLLPPWDTLATLRILAAVIARHDPRIVVSLGDNFHDRLGSVHMPAEFRAMINEMAHGREWIWINGNHDPDGVTDLAGTAADTLDYAGLHFRHEPLKQPQPGEIAGHLHPAATLLRRERAVRRPCFATDGRRMIMPSFGVMTGGLDINNRAFAGLFDKDRLTAHMLSQGRIHSFAHSALRG
ncbi:ligase-associated DNA damage response endonuclease PdeM [Rhizobium sp. KVB221]|uniref:Ligase-associated DNA damage response endonuclease PdeM n=1 Tax=Rhizobium setariae TaxID=2801340 RepID=A0A936YP46_9HYPH|nr:ligase-associated DNA damage response endonuclease PdeM [Rhizobium setariae]MBL0371861.1 ligase-associated DNA damage response endonuclease PdeM [Rhizobium setariae]